MFSIPWHSMAVIHGQENHWAAVGKQKDRKRDFVARLWVKELVLCCVFTFQ
jgi:hypothetical protein